MRASAAGRGCHPELDSELLSNDNSPAVKARSLSSNSIDHSVLITDPESSSG